MRHERETFADAVIELDGNEFDGCEFTRCHFIYRGGQPPTLVNCSFHGLDLQFEGSAQNTLVFLAALYHGGFRTVVDQTFNNIRRNVHGTRPH
jgi:hypothetical protein